MNLYFHNSITNTNTLIQRECRLDILSKLKETFPSWELEDVDGMLSLYNPEDGKCFYLTGE